jgi:sulfopropanediol 3-dehydrogenase
MARYLKQGRAHITEVDETVCETASRIITDVAHRGDSAVREYSTRFDDWNPRSFRLEPDQIDSLCDRVAPDLSEHIHFAAEQVRGFAQAQFNSILPLEIEVGDGIVLGHRLVPVGSVGAYIPGGRYQLISSALMSVLTAKVAGVPRVVACIGPAHGTGPNPATVYAARLAGADDIYCIGGVQALAAMAFGALPGLSSVDVLVGAGNVFVADAKRQLFGRVGIDLLAGPTEILVIADETARPRVVAIDLASQAEHGPTSPAMLVTTSERLGDAVLLEMDDVLSSLPTQDVARRAWDEFGSIVVVSSREEAIAISDEFAPEHLELQVTEPDWYHDRLTNYGSLFIGEWTTVTFGDKASGTNHTLPTQGGARYTGGLFVGKFLKTLTYQTMTREGALKVARASAAISRAEGLIGHARAAEIRFDLEEFPRCPDL